MVLSRSDGSRRHAPSKSRCSMRVATPRPVEIALLDEIGSRPLENETWPQGVPVARATPENAAHPLRRVGEDLLEPAFEGLAVKPLLLVFRSDLELRIDAGLDCALAQEIRAETVNRADAGLFEFGKRRVEPRPFDFIRSRLYPALLDFGTQPELHFTSRFLGEGHGDQPRKPRPAA